MADRNILTNLVSEDRLRNTRAWAAARLDSLSGAEVIVNAIDELLQYRDWHANGRANIEYQGDDIRVCQGHHEKYEPCAFVEYRRADEPSAPRGWDYERWERGFRNIVTALGWPRHEFEIDEVVSEVKRRLK